MPIPKKNFSIVWKHFKKDPNNLGVAICTICKNTYKRSNGTSNLMDHLKRKHFTILNQDIIRNENNEESDDDLNTAGKY